jgi:galactose mutarotase-like enzyme
MTTQHFQISSSDEPTIVQRGGNDELGFEEIEFQDGRRKGVRIVRLVCGSKVVDVIPTRGMGLWQARHGETRFGFCSPVRGPVHPAWVPIAEPDGFGWLDGFDEMSVRCGLTSNGAPEFNQKNQLVHPLHGRIANLPAENVKATIDQEAKAISISATIVESRFHFHRWQLETTISMQFSRPEIRIVDRITNCSDRTSTCQMLYHNNFGAPILEAGSTFRAPVSRLVPRNAHSAGGIADWDRFGPPETSYAEQVYFMELLGDEAGETLALLANADDSLGVLIGFRLPEMPCFTLWKNTVGRADGYAAGLEPGTNFPNPKSFEEANGRVVSLAPGAQCELCFSIGLLNTKALVQDAIDRVESLRTRAPEINAQPTDDWCAD